MIFSMFHCLRSMSMMLIMWFFGMYFRWNHRENSMWSHNSYCRGRNPCSGIEKSIWLKCSGRTLGLMKLHGRWMIRCGLCILHYFLVWENVFLVCVYVYACCYICHNEMLYGCYDYYVGHGLQWLFIVNTASSCVIKIHGKYVLFSVVCW